MFGLHYKNVNAIRVVQNYLASFGLYPSSGMWKFYKRPLTFIYKTMDRVQKKPNSSVQRTPTSESFQVYQLLWL
jgi:hypothetical protein